MLPVVSLLVVLSLSILITRVATSMLTHTGLSREMARFQARSAFSGTGFTTGEAEQIVNHPVRRRIAMTLMLLGNAGIVTTASALILAFVGPGDVALGWKLLLLAVGIGALWALSVSPWVDRRLSNLIDGMLKRYTRLDVRDYDRLLHLAGEYSVSELVVEPDDWIAGRTLAKVRLRDEGVVVLGVVRADGDYVGAPKGDTVVHPGDTLILYGRTGCFEDLDERRKGAGGDEAHAKAVDEHRRVKEEERRREGAVRPATSDDPP